MSLNSQNIDSLFRRHVYIAGPMTGLPEFNYPAFTAMENLFKTHQIKPLNPANIANGDVTKSYDFYIRNSLQLLIQADVVVFLDGWEKSKGAQLEYHAAKLMNLELYDQNFNTLVVKYEISNLDIFDEARRLITGDRNKDYGSPKSNFTDIGRIWGALLRIEDIPPEKVALMMVGLKLSRESFMHKNDNLLDGIGYLGTIEMILKDNT